MKKIVLIVLIPIIVLALVYYIKKSSVKPPITTSARNFLKNTSLELLASNVEGYRLDANGNKLFVIGDSVFVINATSGLIETTLPYPNLYNIYNNNDTTYTYNILDNKVRFYDKSKLFKEEKLIGCDDNVLFMNNEIIYGYSYDSIFLKNYSITSTKKSFDFNIAKVLDSYLKNADTSCLDAYYEGRIYNVNDSNILFFPYKLNIFIVINKFTNSYSVHQTIETVKRINIKQIITILGKDKKACTCQSVDGLNMIQYGATINDKYFIIASNIPNNEPLKNAEYLDFYDIKEFKYQFSKKIIYDSKDELLFDIKSSANFIFILTNKNKVYKLQL